MNLQINHYSKYLYKFIIIILVTILSVSIYNKFFAPPDTENHEAFEDMKGDHNEELMSRLEVATKKLEKVIEKFGLPNDVPSHTTEKHIDEHSVSVIDHKDEDKDEHKDVQMDEHKDEHKDEKKSNNEKVKSDVKEQFTSENKKNLISGYDSYLYDGYYMKL